MFPTFSSLKKCNSLFIIRRCQIVHLNPKCDKSSKSGSPSEPRDCNKYKSSDITSPNQARSCNSADRCRPPNLCLNPIKDPWKTPQFCNSSDHRQNISCRQSEPCKSTLSQTRNEPESYPHKFWPTSRATTWSPAAYIASPCFSSSANCKAPSRFDKPSCPPKNKPTCPSHTCKSKSNHSNQNPSDPCKPPNYKDPCPPTISSAPCCPSPCPPPCPQPLPTSCQPPSPPKPCCQPSQCPPPPCPPANSCSQEKPKTSYPVSPCSTCPTCSPSMNPNIWSQETSRKSSEDSDTYPFYYDKEAELKSHQLRKIVLFGLLPMIALVAGIVFSNVQEERSRPRPEYIPYEYMYRRTKRFPWGDGNHSFFHNPKRNPVPPDGYEEPDSNEP